MTQQAYLTCNDFVTIPLLCCSSLQLLDFTAYPAVSVAKFRTDSPPENPSPGPSQPLSLYLDPSPAPLAPFRRVEFSSFAGARCHPAEAYSCPNYDAAA